jgi:hypothetical protein
MAGGRMQDSAIAAEGYDSFATICAVLTGATGFLYSVAFILLRSDVLSAGFLLLTGLFSTATVIGVYAHLKRTDETFAMLALLLGVAGGMGAAIHGGYDLANALHPPATVNLDLPSQIDPRGMLTFGVAGVALWVIAWLMLRGGQFPRGLAYLGYVTSVLLILVYLARLIVLDATSPLVLVPALVTGFVASPVWYVWLGASLRRSTR